MTVAMLPPILSVRPLVRTVAGGLVVMAVCSQVIIGQNDAQRQRPQAKKAAELIKKQDRPKVSPRVLAHATPDNVLVRISLVKQRAYLMVGDEVGIDSPISSGKRAGMTPKGTFTVIEKDADHRSSLYGDFVNRQGQVVRGGVSTKIDSAPSGTVFRGAPMRWFLRFGEPETGKWRAEGIHTGHLPGYPASHGCVRLPDEIARMIYEKVVIGTRIIVED